MNALCRAISLHCQLLAFTKQKHAFCHTLRHFLHPDPWPTLQILAVTHAAEIWAASKHWLRPPLLLHTNRQPTSTGGSASLPLSSGTWENAHWVHTVVSRRWDLLTSHFRHNVQLLHHRAPCCVAHWHLFHKLFWSSRRLWKLETCSSRYLFNWLSSLLLKVFHFCSIYCAVQPVVLRLNKLPKRKKEMMFQTVGLSGAMCWMKFSLMGQRAQLPKV